MAAWDERDRATATRRILLVLAALIAVIVLRASLDASKSNALGWTTYLVQVVLVLALIGLCLDRFLVLSSSDAEARKAEGLVTTRSLVAALGVVAFGVWLIRAGGQGDLDPVLLSIQLAATLGLLFLGARWLYRKIRDR